jgi:hypothetical protein
MHCLYAKRYIVSFYLIAWLTRLTWRWRQHVSPKRRWTSDVTSQKTVNLLYIVTAVRTSSSTRLSSMRRRHYATAPPALVTLNLKTEVFSSETSVKFYRTTLCHTPEDSLPPAFDPGDWGDMFLRNVGWLSTDNKALYTHKIVLFITIAVRNSNPTCKLFCLLFWMSMNPDNTAWM